MSGRCVAAAAVLAFAVPAAAAPPAPFDWWPVPSPDGTHIAFTRIVSGKGTRMAVDVLDLRTKKLVTVGTSQSQLVPTWSGDSSQLAFSSGGVLRVSRPDGTGKHRYVAPMKAFAPAWRPNSTQLAYLTTHGSQNTDLWVAGALWARDVIGRPAWSPDGSAIAFQRDDGIYVAAGPGIETRLSSIANPGPPAWSSDGKSDRLRRHERGVHGSRRRVVAAARLSRRRSAAWPGWPGVRTARVSPSRTSAVSRSCASPGPVPAGKGRLCGMPRGRASRISRSRTCCSSQARRAAVVATSASPSSPEGRCTS